MGEYTERKLSDEIREVQREHLVEGAVPIRLMKNYYVGGKNKHVKYAIRMATGLPPSLLGYLQVDTQGRLMLALVADNLTAEDHATTMSPIEMQSVRAAVLAALMHRRS